MLAARILQASSKGIAYTPPCSPLSCGCTGQWEGLPELEGILVGNGCTGTKSVSCGTVPGGSFTGSGFGQEAKYAHMHALISDDLWSKIEQ